MTTQPTNKDTSPVFRTLDRYIRMPEVLEIVGVSWRTLLRWEREGRFPKRYKIGPRIVAWKESDLDRWSAAQEIAATSDRGAA